MTTTAPHLTLEELTSATPTAAESIEHLAACPECAAEAASWAAVAAGMQLIASGTRPPSAGLDDVWRAIETDRRGMRRPPVLAASAAAAAVVLAAGGYGLTAGLSAGPRPGGQGTPAGTQVAADLTATGCSGLDITKGVLTQVRGQDLVLAAPGGGAVTVTTSASTTILLGITGSRGDIADGEHVLVAGRVRGGTVAARIIGITPSSLPAPSAPAKPGAPVGTVADAASGRFDVVTASGTRVPVTTSPATRVTITERTSLSQLRTGDGTVAVGAAGPGGTLAASTVAQGPVTPTWGLALPSPKISGVPQPKPKISGVPRLAKRPRLNPPSRGAGFTSPPAKLPLSALPHAKPKPPGGLKLNQLGCAPESVLTSYLLGAAS
jgi:hypothetical protein